MIVSFNIFQIRNRCQKISKKDYDGVYDEASNKIN